MRISDWSSDVCSSDLADGDKLHVRVGRCAFDMGRTCLNDLQRRLSVELMGHVALGNDEARHLTASLIDRMQCRDGAVRIDWKQDSRGVAHLAEQRFAAGRILVRLLVLAVLPRVRGDDEWDRNPARLLADLVLAPREHDLLARSEEHTSAIPSLMRN